MEPLRVALLGAGRIGHIHAENLAQRIAGVQLAWVIDANETAAKACADRFGGKPTTELARALDDKAVRAVIVCSPTNLHSRQIEDAAKAGKDIFCEKPIDFDLGRIDAALGAVAKAGVKLQIGFNRRFDPSFAKARQTIAQGRIGEPQMVRITSRDPAPPPPEYVKASGGLFMDMTIHDFDMARWIVGKEVEEVFAWGANLVDPLIQKLGDVDTAVVALKYRGGCLGAIDNCRRAVYGYDQRVEVLGSEGAVVVGNRTPTQLTVLGKDAVATDKPLHFFLERYQEAYFHEMAAFVECLRSDKAPSPSGPDGKAPILIARAAQQSMKEGRAVRVAV